MGHCWIRSTCPVLGESLLDSFSFALSLVTFTVFHTHGFLSILGFCGIMCVSLSLTSAHCVDSLAMISMTFTVFHTRSFLPPLGLCGIMCVLLSLISAHCLDTLGGLSLVDWTGLSLRWPSLAMRQSVVSFVAFINASHPQNPPLGVEV